MACRIHIDKIDFLLFLTFLSHLIKCAGPVEKESTPDRQGLLDLLRNSGIRIEGENKDGSNYRGMCGRESSSPKGILKVKAAVAAAVENT